MRDFRKMVTTHNIGNTNEECKVKPLKIQNNTDTDKLKLNTVLRNSVEKTESKLFIDEKQINFGFNSFIGSTNTPQDLKVQSKKKIGNLNNNNSQTSGSKSFIVSEKHLQTKATNPMRDRLMTEFLKKKIGSERYAQVEAIL